jgi:hypothetical protein
MGKQTRREGGVESHQQLLSWLEVMVDRFRAGLVRFDCIAVLVGLPSRH